MSVRARWRCTCWAGCCAASASLCESLESLVSEGVIAGMRVGQIGLLLKSVGMPKSAERALWQALGQVWPGLNRNKTRAPLTAADWRRRGAAAHEKQKYLRALAAWKRAAKIGDPEAEFQIGLLYARGEGVIRSIPDAM